MRTPLLRAIRRIMRSQVAASAAVPTPTPRGDGPSRREFMAATVGAAVALPLLSACHDDKKSSARIAIVGGGMAGMHCAYRLREIGVTATVYDGASRIGGRMFSDRMTFGDQVCELGGELIDTPHLTMHDLSTQFALTLDDFTHDADSVDANVGFFTGTKYTQAQLLAAFAPVVPKILSALAEINPGMDDDNFVSYDTPQPNGAKYDDMTVRAWLAANTSGLAQQLLEVAYLIEYGLETDKQSALNLLYLVGEDASKLELFGDSDELYHTHTGNDSFIAKLAGALDASQVQLGHKLVKIAKLADKSYTLTFQSGDGSVEVGADHVVFAIPFTMLRQVTLDGFAWSDVKKKAINELGYGTNAKLMVGFGSRVWRQQGSAGTTYTDEAFQATWETSRGQAGDAGIITNFVGGLHGVAIGDGTPESQRDAFLDGFEKLFPGAKTASNGKVARMHWPTYQFTQGSYACYLPGQYRGFCGEEIKRVDNIHFCGEHTSLDFQGFMEGAAETGAAAADEIAADLGIKSSSLIASQLAAIGAGPDHPSWRIWARARALRAGRKVSRWKARRRG